MRTAVQVRHPSAGRQARAELVWGRPCAVDAGTLGPVAVFAAGEIVAYLLRPRRGPRLFVFRTLAVDDRLAAALPGVRPRVRLLLQLRTPGRIGRARGLFAYLARSGRDPSALADDFYVRVGLALAGRLPAHAILVSLLTPFASAAAEDIELGGGLPARPERAP
jgi:hypothetical protein